MCILLFLQGDYRLIKRREWMHFKWFKNQSHCYKLIFDTIDNWLIFAYVICQF